MPDSPATTEPAEPAPPCPTESENRPAKDSKPTRQNWRVSTWLKLSVAFFVAYILSIGPMFWTWHYAEYFGGNEFIRVFYAPLRLLCEIPLFEDLINRYIRWWIL